MDFEFTDEQRLLKDSVERLMADRYGFEARQHVLREPAGWRLIDDTATGAFLGVPGKIVPRASSTRTGSRWISAQGQIQIETFRLHDASLPALFDQEKKTAKRYVAYSALNSDSFVIIGEQKLKLFVERAQSNGGEIRGVTVAYDQATEGTIAPVAPSSVAGTRPRAP